MSKVKTTLIQKEEGMEEHDSSPVLAYRVGQLEKTTAAGLKDIKHELEGLRNHFVTKTELASAQLRADDKHREQDEKIKSLEGWNIWAVRLVGGAIILAVLGLVLKSTNAI